VTLEGDLRALQTDAVVKRSERHRWMTGHLERV
jgi:hypothetical protein